MTVTLTVDLPAEGLTARPEWTVRLVCRAADAPFKITFVDYDGSIHYSM